MKNDKMFEELLSKNKEITKSSGMFKIIENFEEEKEKYYVGVITNINGVNYETYLYFQNINDSCTHHFLMKNGTPEEHHDYFLKLQNYIIDHSIDEIMRQCLTE